MKLIKFIFLLFILLSFNFAQTSSSQPSAWLAGTMPTPGGYPDLGASFYNDGGAGYTITSFTLYISSTTNKSSAEITQYCNLSSYAGSHHYTYSSAPLYFFGSGPGDAVYWCAVLEYTDGSNNFTLDTGWGSSTIQGTMPTISAASTTISINNSVIFGNCTIAKNYAWEVRQNFSPYSTIASGSFSSPNGNYVKYFDLNQVGSYTIYCYSNISGGVGATSSSTITRIGIPPPTVSSGSASVSFPAGKPICNVTFNGSTSCIPSSAGFEYKSGSSGWVSISATPGSSFSTTYALVKNKIYSWRSWIIYSGTKYYGDTKTLSTTESL